jgi:hypothetical protein
VIGLVTPHGRKVQALLDKVEFHPDWRFELADTFGSGLVLYITLTTVNVLDPSTHAKVCRPFSIHPDSIITDPKHFYGWLRTCISRVFDHEIDEWYKVDGKHHQDPHPELVRSPV